MTAPPSSAVATGMTLQSCAACRRSTRRDSSGGGALVAARAGRCSHSATGQEPRTEGQAGGRPSLLRVWPRGPADSVGGLLGPRAQEPRAARLLLIDALAGRPLTGRSLSITPLQHIMQYTLLHYVLARSLHRKSANMLLTCLLYSIAKTNSLLCTAITSAASPAVGLPAAALCQWPLA